MFSEFDVDLRGLRRNAASK